MVRLGKFEQVVDLEIRPEEQSKSTYEVKARDYVKVDRKDYRSSNRNPGQVSSVP